MIMAWSSQWHRVFSTTMVADQNFTRVTVHDATRSQLSDGALAQVARLHSEVAGLTAAVEQNRPLRLRALGGLRRARRNGYRLDRYPRDFWRGWRGPGAATAAKTDQAALDALVRDGDLGGAAALAAALLPAKAGDARFLEQASGAFGRIGALSLQQHAVTALRRLDDNADRQLLERKIVARIRETEAGWLPAVPQRRAAAEPVAGRVLHLLKNSMPHRQSGYTMRSLYVVDSQRAAGLDPVVLTAPVPAQQTDPDLPPSETYNGTVYHHSRLPEGLGMRGPVDQYLDAYAAAAAELVPELAPWVIHAHSGHRGYEAALVGRALAQAFGLPFVYEVRGFFESLWTQERPWNEQGEIYARRLETENRCMTAADAVVTLSESMRAQIISRGIDAAKVFVVANGVDTTIFRPGERSAELAADLDLTGTFVFGYVSNLDHQREGHETLIRAAAALRAAGVPAVALIVGDGDRRGELEKLAAREGATDAVRFTGRVPHDQVLDYYRLLDAFVVPRTDERAARQVTPLKPFEAMAAGIPLVVSALDPLLEIIGSDGDRGRSFPPGDVNGLVGVLAELAEDPGAGQALAARARTWVVAERDWSVSAAHYTDVYAAIRAGS